MWVFIILSYFVYYCHSKDYCSSEFCNNSKDHVLCKFQSSEHPSICVDYEKLIKTQKHRLDVLNKINSRRNKVASGEIRSLPAAENIIKLVWNEELELSAQRWADQCTPSSSYDSTDSCRDLENTSVGQNVATIYGESPGLIITSLIDVWYMELLNLNVSVLPHYKPSPIKGLHYDYFTQLVWGETKKVGCGGVKFKEINMDSLMHQNRTVHRMVCNFAPAGNRIGQSVYNFGVPCSHCNYGENCDTDYKFLCSQNLSAPITTDAHNEDTEYEKIFRYITYETSKNCTESTKRTELNLQLEKEHPVTMTENIDNKHDFYSDLFAITKSYPVQTERTTKFKELLAVDEFIELLKDRLKNDHVLKDLLLSTTKLPNTESVLSDRTVAAIIDQLYSRKETATTVKFTESENLNSTLLVDLVEAVIFRHSDKFGTTEEPKLSAQSMPYVRPVKIQAELGEIKANKEFTGHYFFPEDEQTDEEKTDSYDETENIPITEIAFEIEHLKRDSTTKDFLEEILESDFNTDSSRNNISPAIENFNGKHLNSVFNDNNWLKVHNFTLDQHVRSKRGKYSGSINYYDLLKKLADDLKVLKLLERFHCVHSSVEKLYHNVLLFRMIYVVDIFKYVTA